jgi:hypothetical protein
LRWPALGCWQPHSWSSDGLVSAAQSSAATQPLLFSAQAASSAAVLAGVEEVAFVDAVEEAAVDDVAVVAAVEGVVVAAAAEGDVVAVDAAAVAAVPVVVVVVVVVVAAAVVGVEAGVETFLQADRMDKYRYIIKFINCKNQYVLFITVSDYRRVSNYTK